MVSLLPNLSSPISRLSLLWRPSIHLTRKLQLQLQLHQKTVKPKWFKSFSAHCSNSISNENLVVLGIETSCDDTAAAVVTSF